MPGVWSVAKSIATVSRNFRYLHAQFCRIFKTDRTYICSQPGSRVLLQNSFNVLTSLDVDHYPDEIDLESERLRDAETGRLAG